VRLALAFLTAFTSSGLAQPDADRFRFEVSADAVRLDVAVTTAEGRYVPGLTAEDFQIYEDGVPQTVTNFTSESTPVSIVLLLDVSSSIHPSIDGIKSGAYRFVGGMREGDVMLVGFFNHKLWFTADFTHDAVVLAREIRAMRASGMTALYDAILASVNVLSTISGRKALVLFADGDDSRPAAEGSVASRADAFEAGKISDASIYTVGFRGRRAAGRGVNRGFMRTLARESGGLAFFPKSPSELVDSFERIQRELHSQYQLAYTPSNRQHDGSWRTIEVHIAGAEHLRVRTRQGYYAETGGGVTSDQP
jgi:Ca-activated chloride channel family protein